MSDDAIRKGLELENQANKLSGDMRVGVFGDGVVFGVTDRPTGLQRTTVLLSAQDVRNLRDYLTMALESWEG